MNMVKAQSGFWDVTAHPTGGYFRRIPTDTEITDLKVVAVYNDGTPREYTGFISIGDKIRKIHVKAEFVTVEGK